MKFIINNATHRYCKFAIGIITTSLMAASCISGYTVISTLSSDGSLNRTIYTEANSKCLAGDYTQHPFLFVPDEHWSMGKTDAIDTIDFIGETIIHNFKATRKYNSPAQTTEIPVSEDAASLPYMNGKEEWTIKKSLFVNRYCYKCTFPGIAQTMPLPLDRYMSTEEQEAWLESGIALSYPYMNGLELYSLLYDFNRKFSNWHKDCITEVAYKIITADTKDTLDAEQKAELFKRIRILYSKSDDEWLFDTPDMSAFAKIMTEISSNVNYLAMSETFKDKWEKDLDEELFYTPFMYVFRHIVEMPGHLSYTNTSIIENGHPVWKVDGFRLLGGDVTIVAESKQANPLGFVIIITMIFLSCIAIIKFCRKNRK